MRQRQEAMSAQNSGSTGGASASHRGTVPEQHQPDVRHTFNEIIRIVMQHQRVFLVPFFLVATVALLGSHYLPRHYEASTVFERRNDMALTTLVQNNSPFSFSELRRSIDLDLRGPDAVGRAMGEIAAGLQPGELIGLEQSLAADVNARRKVLYKLNEGVGLRFEDKSTGRDVIRITCKGGDPVFVARFANQLRENYVRETRARITSILEDAKAYFGSETNERRQVVERLMDQLAGMETEFPNVDPDNPASIYMQMSELQSRHDERLRKKQELQAQVRAREGYLDTFETMAGSNRQPGAQGGLVVAAGSEHVRLEGQIAAVRESILDRKLTRGMTEAHPEVVAQRDRLAKLQAQIAGMPIGAVGAGAVSAALPPSTAWNAQQARIHMESQALMEILALTEQQLQQADDDLTRFKQMQVKLGGRGRAFREQQDELDREKGELALRQSNLNAVMRHLAVERQDRGVQFVTLAEAGVTYKPISPRASMLFAVALALGAAVGALCVVIAELADRTFRTAGQVRRSLGLPIIEGVGEIVTPAVRRQRLITQMVVTPVIGVLLMVALLLASAATYLRLERPDVYHRARVRSDQIVSQSADKLARGHVMDDMVATQGS